MWLLIVLSFLVAYPLSKLLDWVIGEHEERGFRRNELKELVKLHGEGGMNGGEGGAHHEGGGPEGPLGPDFALTTDEVSIIRGALRYDMSADRSLSSHFESKIDMR